MWSWRRVEVAGACGLVKPGSRLTSLAWSRGTTVVLATKRAATASPAIRSESDSSLRMERSLGYEAWRHNEPGPNVRGPGADAGCGGGRPPGCREQAGAVPEGGGAMEGSRRIRVPTGPDRPLRRGAGTAARPGRSP